MSQSLLHRDFGAPDVTNLVTVIQKQIIIVLPCFNEEKNLTPLVNRIYQTIPNNFGCRVIAVDDGSSDGTAAIIQDLSTTFRGIFLIKHSTNKGLSKALQTGVKSAIASAKPDDLVVIMDADNTHDPALIQQMADRLSEGFDVVIASRYVKEGSQSDLPPLRIALSRILNVMIYALARLPVNDATSGFRGYRASLLSAVLDTSGERSLESRGFEVSLEILTRSYWCGGRLCEIPLQLEYGRKIGASKMHLLPTIRGYIRLFSQINRWRTTVNAKL